MISLTLASDIGVDIERLDITRDYDVIASECLSPSELDQYRQLPQSKRADEFIRTWTKKEAIVKAIGKGITYPLKNIDVSLGSADSPVRFSSEPPPASEWTLISFEPADAYQAALAVAGPGLTVKYCGHDAEGPSYSA